jgi:hypothetical protein
MLFLRTLLFSLLAVTGFTADSITASDCGVAPVFGITALSILPAIPVVGQNATLTSDYQVPATVTGGTAKYACFYNGIPVMSESYDLCTQTTCPIGVGAHSDKSIVAVPDIKGSLVCTIKWADVAGQELMCIKTKIQLGASALRGVVFQFVEFPFLRVEDETEAMTLYVPQNHRNDTCIAIENSLVY